MNRKDIPRVKASVGEPAFTADPPQSGHAAIENDVVLLASPLLVWSVLTDFARHSEWKPFTQLSGDAVEGGDAAYSFRVAGLGKPITAEANIVRAEKPVAFAWTAGVERLLLFEEIFLLEADPGGTRLRHSLRFQGIFSGLWAALLRRRLQLGLVQSDRCLARQLSRIAAPPAPAPRPLSLARGGNGFRKSR